MEKDRKLEHINLALDSQVFHDNLDNRFYYEPVLGKFNQAFDFDFSLAGKKLHNPIWISSMTGGTPLAKKINQNLAQACNDFGLGMGLGSCRSILENDDHLSEFDVRDIIGNNAPLYANLGIAQIEILLQSNKLFLIDELIKKLRADGLIIHVNPLQEWLQPEGNVIKEVPIITIKRILDKVNYPIIVKEVGQGMGPKSLAELMSLPIEAVEFGAFGGTNFSLVELSRSEISKQELYKPLVRIGHTAAQMVNMLNEISSKGNDHRCKKVIISGGIKNFLDGYYYIRKSKTPAIYAQASAFLKYARNDYEDLKLFIESQIKGLELAYSYLRIKEDKL